MTEQEKQCQREGAKAATKWAAIFFLIFLASLLVSWALHRNFADAQDKPQPLTFPPRSGYHLILPAGAADGDTVHFYWLIRDTGRLKGINAPELRDKGGPEAKAYLAKLLPSQPCKARVWGRDKYGRALIDIYQGDKTLGQLMIEAGHAKAWDGKGERP